MAGGGPGVPGLTNIFEARLKTDLNGASSEVTLLPYKGRRVEVNGGVVVVPTAGLTRNVGDNLIAADGTDSGGAAVASTLYYVYVSNALATFRPSSIALSATAPSIVNGVKYLAGAGNGANWRFVGWVRTNATPQFEMTDTNALICNYYNRELYTVFANPAYANDNAQTSYAVDGNWASVNGGVGSRVGFIANGEDSEIIRTNAIHQGTLAADVYSGPGIDGAPPLKATRSGGPATLICGCSADDSKILSEGYHTADLYGAGDAGAVFIADLLRLGAAADPRGSMVIVSLFV